MKAFMDKDFLLSNETAKRLYHEYAEELPIIDYHCHIPPKDIALNSRFGNVTQALLGGGNYGDHYIWRLLRACGFPEEEITGDGVADLEKDRLRFHHLAEAMERSIGNPVYQWLHLELQRYFGVTKPLNRDTADEIFDACNAVLSAPDMNVRKVIADSNVDVICTTDDPADTLEWHKMIAEEGALKAKVLPAMRPDKAMNVEKEGFAEYIKVLGEAAGIEIKCINCLKNAMKKRMDFFGEMGCSVTDHGLDYVPFRPATDEEVNAIFQKGLRGEAVTDEEAEAFKTWMMLFLGREYAERGWVMQLHYGAIRNNNTKMYRLKGPDTGFDAISDRLSGTALAKLLDALAVEGKLPKTIVYSLNPNDNAMITTVMSCFQVGYGDRNHVQHGSAWWFNDTKPGMEQQITNLANESVLGNFVGMLTDSRSFLSYARHEYFRRVLCNVIGTWVENGEYPDDERALREIVRGVCYYNAKEYFGF